MNRTSAVALGALLLAGCAPNSDDMVNTAVAACQRADVQDVVSKETRNQMIQPNIKRLLIADWWGINVKEILNQVEAARSTFEAVGTMTRQTPGEPFKQIICGGKLQLDMSTGVAGQQIFGIPRLRWAINFSDPTTDPSTGGFSVEVDPASIHDGMTFNGMPAGGDPAEASGDPNDADATQAERPAADSVQGSDEAAQAAAAAAEDFKAASEPDRGGDQRTEPNRQPVRAPNEDDLYAPHGN